jgi:thiamine-monophosphate kinase
MDEFELIGRYFKPLNSAREEVSLGIGDDGAVIKPRRGRSIVVSVDTLIEGQHFPVCLDAYSIGFRAAASSLSDLAAMGACPLYATLALTLPGLDETWVSSFASGFGDAIQKSNTVLIGGDTTRGPLSITVQIIGDVEHDRHLSRAGAKQNDIVVVSGTLGDARGGLELLSGSYGYRDKLLLDRFKLPTPRVTLGLALSGLASACIDVSDGLVADLGHIAKASDVSMEVKISSLPVSTALIDYCAKRKGSSHGEYAATGGDDYELAMTVPSDAKARLEEIAEELAIPLTVIGRVVGNRGSGPAVRCVDDLGKGITYDSYGFNHFL